MVHMVKGRQYSAYTVQATLMMVPQSQRWSLRPTFDLDNDKFQLQETNSTALYSFQTSGWLWHGTQRVCYINIAKASFIYPRDYVSQENA